MWPCDYFNTSVPLQEEEKIKRIKINPLSGTPRHYTRSHAARCPSHALKRKPRPIAAAALTSGHIHYQARGGFRHCLPCSVDLDFSVSSGGFFSIHVLTALPKLGWHRGLHLRKGAHSSPFACSSWKGFCSMAGERSKGAGSP